MKVLFVASQDAQWPYTVQLEGRILETWPTCTVVPTGERNEINFQIPDTPGFSMILAPGVITADGTSEQNATTAARVVTPFAVSGIWGSSEFRWG